MPVVGPDPDQSHAGPGLHWFIKCRFITKIIKLLVYWEKIEKWNSGILNMPGNKSNEKCSILEIGTGTCQVQWMPFHSKKLVYWDQCWKWNVKFFHVPGDIIVKCQMMGPKNTSTAAVYNEIRQEILRTKVKNDISVFFQVVKNAECQSGSRLATCRVGRTPVQQMPVY